MSAMSVRLFLRAGDASSLLSVPALLTFCHCNQRSSTKLSNSTIAIHLLSFSGKMRPIQSRRPTVSDYNARLVMRSAVSDAVIRIGYSIPIDTIERTEIALHP